MPTPSAAILTVEQPATASISSMTAEDQSDSGSGLNIITIHDYYSVAATETLSLTTVQSTILQRNTHSKFYMTMTSISSLSGKEQSRTSTYTVTVRLSAMTPLHTKSDPPSRTIRVTDGIILNYSNSFYEFLSDVLKLLAA